MHHRPVRLQPPPPLRAVLYSRRWSGAQAVHGPPGDPRLHGALHGHTHRALRRRVPSVAGPDAGLASPDYRPPCRIRPVSRCPNVCRRPPSRSRRPGRTYEPQDPGCPAEQGPLHAHSRRQRGSAETLSVRKRNGENLGPQPLASVIEMLQTDIAART